MPQINLAEEQAKWAQQQHAHELKLIEQRATFSAIRVAPKKVRSKIIMFLIMPNYFLGLLIL